MSDWLLFLLIALVGLGGGFVQRTTGFGFGIFVMLFLPYLTPSQGVAAAVAGLISCVISGFNAILYRKHLQIRLALPLMAAAAVTIPIAVSFSSFAPDGIMRMLLGSVLILFSLYFLFFSSRVKLRPSVFNGMVAGALGGTLSGLFSTGGPPAVLYLVHAAPDKSVYFATIQTYFCLTSIYSAVFRAFHGVIDPTVLLYAAVGVMGCFIGNLLGNLVFRRLNERTFKLVIYIGMIVSGILMFF